MVERTPDGRRLWLPILDSAERVGVLGLLGGDEDPIDDWLSVASLLGELVVSKEKYGDLISRVRRRKPVSLAAEMRWSLLPPLTFSSPLVTVSGILQPSYGVAGDAFDYAVRRHHGHGRVSSTPWATASRPAGWPTWRSARSVPAAARGLDSADDPRRHGRGARPGVRRRLVRHRPGRGPRPRAGRGHASTRPATRRPVRLRLGEAPQVVDVRARAPARASARPPTSPPRCSSSRATRCSSCPTASTRPARRRASSTAGTGCSWSPRTGSTPATAPPRCCAARCATSSTFQGGFETARDEGRRSDDATMVLAALVPGVGRRAHRDPAAIGCEEAEEPLALVLVGAAEDLADGLVLEHGVDRLGEDLGDGELLDLVDLLLRRAAAACW